MQLSQITVVGNLTRSPEFRYTSWGDAEATFTVASNERRFNRDKREWEDGDTTYIRVRSRKKLAESVRDSLDKGHRVVIVGRQRLVSWNKRDGTPVTELEVHANHIGPDLLFQRVTVERSRVTGDGSSPVGVEPNAADEADAFGGDANGAGATPGTAPQPVAVGAGVPAGEGGWAQPGAMPAVGNDEPPF